MLIFEVSDILELRQLVEDELRRAEKLAADPTRQKIDRKKAVEKASDCRRRLQMFDAELNLH